jgi:hypothetical protein
VVAGRLHPPTAHTATTRAAQDAARTVKVPTG